MTRIEEVQTKLDSLRALMAEEDLQTLVLGTQANFAWLTAGGDNHVALAAELGVGTLVVTESRQFLVTENIEAGRLADEELRGLDFEVVQDEWHRGNLRDLINGLAEGQVGADGQWLPGADDMSGEIARRRWQLLPPEIDRYRQVGADVARCLEQTAREIEPGHSEHAIAGALAGKLKGLGIAPNVILIAVDDRLRKYRHPIPTATVLERCAMLVASVKRHGLCVSATRIVHFGPLPEDLRRRHDACMQVDACLNLGSRPGAGIAALFRQALQTYADTGYADEWQLHHQGGATGYAPREYRVSPETRETVLEHQAFAWNPSITGTKSEDTILATADGPEILTPAADWPLVEVSFGGGMMPRPDILVR
jgi:Xaa-Pro aminopeptidase